MLGGETTGSYAPSAGVPTVPDVELVVPARNEARRIGPTLAALAVACRELAATGTTVAVVVVDNASVDDTADHALAAATATMPVRVVRCPVRGKGAAVRAGILATTAPVVGFLDADGATDLDVLAPSIEMVRAGAPVVVGSRADPESIVMVRTEPARAVGAAAFRYVTARVVPGVGDTQCGYKIFHGAVVRDLVRDLRTVGFGFDVELLARAHRRGLAISPVPVRWQDVAGSTFSPTRHGLASFLSVGRTAWLLRDLRPVAASRPAAVPQLPPDPRPAATPIDERTAAPAPAGAVSPARD